MKPITRWSMLVSSMLVTCPGVAAGQHTPVPHPRDVLGFTPGDDYRIADFGQLRAYFEALAAASPRVQLEVAGRSTEGREMLIVAISSEANLAQLDRYRAIARRLALARDLTEADAAVVAREGRAIVWIDAGLHAVETAHAQHAPLLAHRVATDESDEMRTIRDQVILVLAPVVDPDGLDRVADWYRRTVHTPYQDSPMPWLFNTYVGYDNNRDYFMQTQEETRVVSRLLYREWLPQIVYNHHQGFYPTRIFVPPFPDPFNPNIDAGVLRGIELVGAAMQNRFEREGKDGVISRYGFSSWYNGSLRTTTYFHNMIGILSETTHDTPSPFYYDPARFPETFSNGWSTREPSSSYPRPWAGGTLRFRDAIDYMLTASLAVLDVAARYREDFLYRSYQIGSRQIALGRTVPPVAYVVPPEQHDAPVAHHFLEILMRGGVEVHRARRAFTADGVRFPVGSYVILLAQAFRPFVKDLLEPQRYPELRAYPGGPPVPPYDNAGWTLSMQMGVRAVPVTAPFEAALEVVEAFPRPAGMVRGAARHGYALDPRSNNTASAVNRLLDRGMMVERATGALTVGNASLPAGTIVVPRAPGVDSAISSVAAELGLLVRGLATPPAGPRTALRAPRIGIYRSFVVEWVDGWTAAEGWTRFVMDHYGYRYTSLTNADVRAGSLAQRFDVIVVPNQDVSDIVGGYRAGRRQFGAAHQNLPPPEYQGGIGQDGIAALGAFAAAGGTLLLVDRSADLAEALGLPVRNVLAGMPEREFFGPGSIVRIAVDVSHPLAFGMPRETAAYFRHSRAFAFDSPDVRSIVRYGSGGADVLLSGWLLGGERLAGTHAAVEVRVGTGRVILLGFPAYFRAQPHGTFKLLLNALYVAADPEPTRI